MRKPVKAVLLSALVLPGAGHIYLRFYKTGVTIALVAFAAVCILIAIAVERARTLSEMILAGEVPPDFSSILSLVSSQANAQTDQMAEIATVVVCVAWVVGLLDCYRVSRLSDGPIQPAK